MLGRVKMDVRVYSRKSRNMSGNMRKFVFVCGFSCLEGGG